VDVTPHTLRHTAATWAAMAGVPMDEIARLLGASVTVVEKIYAKWHPEYLRRAVQALDGA
jgi:integrase